MISAIVLTKNEENNLRRCLESLVWVDEILVIDDKSTDKTIQIAHEFGAKVFVHSLSEDFSQQRNFALRKARGEWIFFVDADEEVSLELQKEIQKELSKNNKNISGYFLKRIDFFEGKWLKHGEIGKVRLLRLARRNSGSWQRKVDETWNVKGKTKTLSFPLLHYSHQDLDHFLAKINQRSSLNALVFFEQKKKNSFFDWFKPIFKFLQNYVCRLGFIDGVFGFVFALMMSLHSFMVRSKLYLLWKNNAKRKA